MSQTDSNTFVKDPEAILDYVWDWSQWLGGSDSIASYTVTVDRGDIVLDSDENTSSTVTAWFSGGTKFSSAVCRIVTLGNRTDERTIYLQIDDK